MPISINSSKRCRSNAQTAEMSDTPKPLMYPWKYPTPPILRHFFLAQFFISGDRSKVLPRKRGDLSGAFQGALHHMVWNSGIEEAVSDNGESEPLVEGNGFILRAKPQRNR